MGLFDKGYNIPVVINDIINNIAVRRSAMYLGKIIESPTTGKKIIIKGWKNKEFQLPKSEEWVMTSKGRGLEINVYNPDHHTFVKSVMIDKKMIKEEADQESIGLAIILKDVLRKYDDKAWWDTDIFRTSAILVIFLLIIMVSMFYMGNMTKEYVGALKDIDNKRHIEEMSWINATTDIQDLLKYNVNIMPTEVGS